MRDILFRGFHPCEDGKETIWVNGKEIKGDWVFGNFVKAEKLDYSEYEYFIIQFGADGYTYEVIPETVGQYIGQTDMHEKSIFEHDLIGIPKSNRKGLPAMVRYNSRTASFDGERIGYNPILLNEVEYWGEIVGNKWSNPEL